MRTAPAETSVSLAEAKQLFAGFRDDPMLVLAVSGGPDSTALMILAARWRAAIKRGPELVAVTIDHGLRPESKAEAAAVAKLARQFGVTHRTVVWRGLKPKTGLQQAARIARYGLLAESARACGAARVLTAHTRDDQAETVLIRLARGSGVSGLAAMAKETPLAALRAASARARARTRNDADAIMLVRPFLDIPKARLMATLARDGIEFAHDPSNADPRFTRVRVRRSGAALEREGLTAARLALLARRIGRSEAAVEMAVDFAAAAIAGAPWAARPLITIDVAGLRRLPHEVALRLIGRALAHAGGTGPVELGKLESFTDALLAELAENPANARFRRTLGGAVATLANGQMRIECAPPRRQTRSVQKV